MAKFEIMCVYLIAFFFGSGCCVLLVCDEYFVSWWALDMKHGSGMRTMSNGVLRVQQGREKREMHVCVFLKKIGRNRKNF